VRSPALSAQTQRDPGQSSRSMTEEFVEGMVVRSRVGFDGAVGFLLVPLAQNTYNFAAGAGENPVVGPGAPFDGELGRKIFLSVWICGWWKGLSGRGRGRGLVCSCVIWI
jgi:hypothetical protein